jgi:hypothetical protein
MATGAIGQGIEILQQVGFFQYVLPFLLTFAIVYGVLEKINLLGKTDDQGNREGDAGKKVHAIVALSIAFFVTVFTPAGTSLATFFTNYFGGLSVALVGVLGALVLYGLVFGKSPSDGDNFPSKAVTWLVLLIAVAIFLGWGGLGFLFPGAGIEWLELPGWTSAELVAIAIIVAVVIFLAWVLDIGFPSSSGSSQSQQQSN